MSDMTEFGKGYSVATGTQSKRDLTKCALVSEWCDMRRPEHQIIVFVGSSRHPAPLVPVCYHHGAQVQAGKYPGWMLIPGQ